VDGHESSGWARARPLLLTTLVPVVAALGILMLAVYGKKSPSIKDQPSMAAFDACLTAHELQSTGDFPSQFDETVLAQAQMRECGEKIPKKVIEDAQRKQDAQRQEARSSYRECMQNLGGSGRPRNFGRYRSGPSQGYRDAFAICRSLLQGGDEGGRQTPKAKTQPAAPVA
jgi:hypothetical protein